MLTTKKLKNRNKPPLESIFSNTHDEMIKTQLINEIIQMQIDNPTLKKISVEQNMTYEELYYTYNCLVMNTTKTNTSD